MLYTHAWGLFFGAGAALALIPIWLTRERRPRALLRDAVLAFVGARDPVPAVAAELHLPVDAHRRAVGAAAAVRRAGADLPRPDRRRPDHDRAAARGGHRVRLAVHASATGARARRRCMWTLIVLPLATLLLAWLASQITPAFVSRYFAPVLGADPAARRLGRAPASGIVGLVAIVLSVVFVAHISSYAPQYKSDMRDVGGEMAPLLHPGDLVIVRPARAGAAGLLLPARAGCDTRTRSGPSRTRRT